MGCCVVGMSLSKVAYPRTKDQICLLFREIMQEHQGELSRSIYRGGILAPAQLENMPIDITHVHEWRKISTLKGDFSVIMRV